jgi:hypothetical protein
MHKLEDKIRNQREAFDSFEPSRGHMERFAGRLERPRRTFLRRIPQAVRIAAMVCLVAVTSILVYEQLDQSDTGRVSDMLMQELNDVEFYYTSLIREKTRAIDRFTSNDPEHNRMLMAELESMDRMLSALQKDLQASPSDERIIHAMISHYEMKLDVMTQILNQLKNVKQVTKNEKDEDTEV